MNSAELRGVRQIQLNDSWRFLDLRHTPKLALAHSTLMQLGLFTPQGLGSLPFDDPVRLRLRLGSQVTPGVVAAVEQIASGAILLSPTPGLR